VKLPRLGRGRAGGVGGAVRPGHGVVVAEFFDVGQSRTVAWGRRPEAAALVAQLADPGRGWDAIVIGEYERAFYGSQYAAMAPLTEDLPSVGAGLAGQRPGELARVGPLLRCPAGRRATARLAAGQVSRRHRIMVIRATRAPQSQSSADGRENAGSGPPQRTCAPSFKHA
jgi:hypothetical protein